MCSARSSRLCSRRRGTLVALSAWRRCPIVGDVGASDLPESDAGDVGGEEVDAVPVEVSSGAVVMLCGSGVGVAGEDLGVA